MRDSPAIAAFRADAPRQQRARLAMEAALAGWRAGPLASVVLRDLERYGGGRAFAECRALHLPLHDLATARAFVAPLMQALGEALGAHPLGQVPLRYRLAGGHAVLQLASAGRAILSLLQYDRSACDEALESVCFTDGERREICLRGSANARRVVASQVGRAQADLTFECVSLRPGSQMAFTSPRETKVVDRTDGSFTLLRLSRQAERPSPSHEYRLRDGALLHRAASACRESRDELAMAVLGGMKRRDAVPAFIGIIENRARSESLRWQALRECLALDSAAGFGALGRIANDRGDPLHAPARTLHADLCARHPQLASRETTPCPA